MPNNPLAITISKSDPNPNGDSAVVHENAANGANQATWKASDTDYEIDLPASVFTPPSGWQLKFTLQKGNTSPAFTVKSTAPTGLQGYTVTPTSTTEGPPGGTPPKIMVDP